MYRKEVRLSGRYTHSLGLSKEVGEPTRSLSRIGQGTLPVTQALTPPRACQFLLGGIASSIGHRLRRSHRYRQVERPAGFRPSVTVTAQDLTIPGYRDAHDNP